MTSAAARKAARFAGTWALEAWELHSNGELDAYPHGPNGEGRLVLSSNGQLSAFLQRADWPAADTGVRPSWDKFVAFGGAWRVEGDSLMFEIAFASEPRWIGRTFERPASLVAGKLVYQTPERLNRKGERIVHKLIWRKPQ